MTDFLSGAPKKYRTIVIDPPWRYENDRGTQTSSHSQKPEAFLDLVERVSPSPRLEMFARRQRLGWDTWGNESLEHVSFEANLLEHR